MNVSLFYSHRIFFQKSRKMIKGKMAGKEKKKKKERKCSKSLFPVAYLKIPHYFLDTVSIEDECFKESWKSFVRILSCQAAYSGFIPTNLHIHQQPPGNK